MKIIHGIEKIKRFRRAVVALGVFDGVHIGHMRVLQAAVKKARAIGSMSVVVTFYPHPQGEHRLYSLEHRLRLIAAAGIDVCVVINFTPQFARTRAEDFVRKIIAGKIGTAFIYVGENFRFGYRAAGDSRLLERLSAECGYGLKVFKAVKTNREPVSSTRIRRLITGGKLGLAGKLLTRSVTVLGTVIRGASLARRIGFPTANINPHHEILPPSGVYAVKVLLGGKIFNGVCSIGKKPTVIARPRDKHVEVYIFNFRKDIYGQDLEIQFIKKIREEVKFPTLEDLACQIRRDVKKAKNILSA